MYLETTVETAQSVLYFNEVTKNDDSLQKKTRLRNKIQFTLSKFTANLTHFAVKKGFFWTFEKLCESELTFDRSLLVKIAHPE